MGRFDGKVAMVTGGAEGLGRAISERLSSEGAQVAISDVNAELGEQTAAACGFAFLEHDIRDEQRWFAAVAEVEERLGRLDVLVNNAGIIGDVEVSNPENTSLEDWNRVFAVNVTGVFLGCKAALPALRRAGGGLIVNISSVAALLATPDHIAYGAAKACVRHMTKSVAQYCAQEKLNIRVNSIHPGVMQTAIWKKLAARLGEARGVPAQTILDESTARIPLGDWTRAEDVAAAVAFLVSDDARQITGEKLIVDGGVVNLEADAPYPESSASSAWRSRIR